MTTSGFLKAGTEVTGEPREFSGLQLSIPAQDRSIVDYRIPVQIDFAPSGLLSDDRARTFYAAPHVVVDPLRGEHSPSDVVDWDATIAFREHVWNQGVGIAEAMDTAQRGMGLSWENTKELIDRTARAAGTRPFVCGVGTDQLGDELASLQQIEAAYRTQCDFVEERGGIPVIMASRTLTKVAGSSADYLDVYRKVIDGTAGPVVLHWLGEVFDPELRGYWGTTSIDDAIDTVSEFIGEYSGKIQGIKVSLLETQYELRVREGLPPSVTMYTGDDFNYPDLIAGDGARHSDALLGAFNPLARLAGTALDLLDAGADSEARALLESSLPLSRHVFASPTQFYKTGIVFLAYLNGHQNHFRMLAGLESARSVPHLAQIFVLAAEAGLLEDLDLAYDRMKRILSVSGIEG